MTNSGFGRGTLKDGKSGPAPTTDTSPTRVRPGRTLTGDPAGTTMWGRGHSSRQHVHPGRRLTIAAALTAVTLVAGVAAQNGSNATPAVQPAASPEEQQARVTCGGCHAVPPPDILPKAQWRDEFLKMMYLRENRLPPLGPP